VVDPRVPVAGGSEIAAHDPVSQRLFVVNAPKARVDVLSIANPSAPTSAGKLDASAHGGVAIRGDLIAVAVESNVKTDPGKVVFYNRNLQFLSAVTVGPLPDMLTFTPDGRSCSWPTKVSQTSTRPATPSMTPQVQASILRARGV
jgi:hypothetical protein